MNAPAGEARVTAPPVRAVIVIGLSHSGSTMLDLSLGSHPNIVGTGEIFNFSRHWLEGVLAGNERPCTCGLDIRDCELWGGVIHSFESDGRAVSPEAAYGAVVDQFRAAYPGGTILLDSSKRMAAVDLLRAVGDVDISVLFLVRDVRGWMASELARSAGRRAKRHRRLGRSGRSTRPLPRRVLADLWGDSRVALAHQWRRKNLARLAEVARRDVPMLVVSYERLCLDPEATLGGICRFLGIDAGHTLSPGESSSHVVTGNAVRHDEVRRRRLTYDTRWMKRLDWVLPYVLVPGVRRLNRQLVWGDGTPGAVAQPPAAGAADESSEKFAHSPGSISGNAAASASTSER